MQRTSGTDREHASVVFDMSTREQARTMACSVRGHGSIRETKHAFVLHACAATLTVSFAQSYEAHADCSLRATVIDAPGPAARGGVYLSGDVHAAARLGRYRWSSPPAFTGPGIPDTVEMRSSFDTAGVELTAAIGWRVARSLAIAVEGCFGYQGFGSTPGLHLRGYGAVAYVRVGGRVDAELGKGVFLRPSIGFESSGFAGGGVDIGAYDNVVTAETVAGGYAALAGGWRSQHVGASLRLMAGEQRSAHGTYAYLSIGAGLELLGW